MRLVSSTILVGIYALATFSPNLFAQSSQPAEKSTLAHDVRLLLQKGEHEKALKRLGFEGKLPPLVALPGLLGQALETQGEHTLACKVYENDQKAHPERSEIVEQRRARCLAALGKKEEASAAWLRVLETPSTDIVQLDLAFSALRALGEDELMVKQALAQNVLELPAPPKDVVARQAMANVFYALTTLSKDKEVVQKAQKRLYLEFGENALVKKVLKQKNLDRALFKDLDNALVRARSLSVVHDNKQVVNTLNAFRFLKSDKSEQACEARYLLGKAARKTRRYKSARYHLDFVSRFCASPYGKKARYLAAQVATFQNAKDAHRLYADFLAQYPSDTLSDDVLVFQAKRFTAQNKLNDAQKTYQRIIDDYPEGDQIEHARFKLAFLRAQNQDINAARAVLDDLARTSKDPNTVDRALYWKGRLLVYPTLMSWKPTPSTEVRDQGLSELRALAQARTTSFYGHMARMLVFEVSKEWPEIKTISRRESGEQTMIEDPLFLRASALASAGYDVESAKVLDRFTPEKPSQETLLAIAQLYSRIGGEARGHQVLRFSGNAQLHGKPSEKSVALWSVNYPRAHASSITKAMQAVNLAPQLLFGLSREESAFNDKVVSWAGAIGLCQLMPFTAKEEAQLLKLKTPTLETLRTPDLNARLGANHLARRMSLGHPLLAIGAYNAGPGNIKKWRKRGYPKGAPLDAFIESIPVEQTRRYIQKVTGSWIVYSALDGGLEDLRFSMTLP